MSKGPSIKPMGTKKAKDEDNDDPIEKSLNERIALGGVTQVAKSDAKPTRPSVKMPPQIRNPVQRVDSSKDDDKKGPNATPRGAKSSAPDLNRAPSRFGEKPGFKKGKDDDNDDPIA